MKAQSNIILLALIFVVPMSLKAGVSNFNELIDNNIKEEQSVYKKIEVRDSLSKEQWDKEGESINIISKKNLKEYRLSQPVDHIAVSSEKDDLREKNKKLFARKKSDFKKYAMKKQTLERISEEINQSKQ